MGRHINVSTYVDVDVDPADIEDAGYHHEDDCPAKTGRPCAHADLMAVDAALDLLHREAGHGDYPIHVCTREPCRSLFLIPLGDDGRVARKRVAA